MFQYKQAGQQWTPMQQQRQQLPAGWEAKWDPNTSRWFYVNHNTKQTQWEPPQPSPAVNRQETTSFIQADPEKVKTITSEFENVSPELVKSLLRINQNNLVGVRTTLLSRGYLEKKPFVEPKPVFVSSLQRQYPTAPVEIIKEALSNTSNNFSGARVGLEAMGFKKQALKPKTTQKVAPKKTELASSTPSNSSTPSKSTTPKKSMSNEEKEKLVQKLKKKFPEIKERLIKLSLEGTMYDLDLAISVLNASVASVSAVTNKRSDTSPASSCTVDVSSSVPSTRSLSPVIFGAEDVKSTPTTAAPATVSTTSSTQPRPIYTASSARKYIIPKRQVIHREVTPARYTSALRIKTAGPNPIMCSGPDPTLLSSNLLIPNGSDPSIRTGPQLSNRCGSDPSIVKGRAGIDQGPMWSSNVRGVAV